MDINTLLSTVVLVSFIVTIILAVGSYLAFKGREADARTRRLASRSGEPVFFERIYMQARKVEASAPQSGVREAQADARRRGLRVRPSFRLPETYAC